MNGEAWLVGPRGQALAAGLAVSAVMIIWFGVVDPLRTWYADRDMLLEQRQTLLLHMRAVAQSLPALRSRSANRRSEGDVADRMLLPGATDAVAAADLQERIQKMATAAGINLTAVETLPPSVTGQWHKVPLRISLSASWPVLAELMRAIQQSDTRILIDDVRFHSPTVVSRPASLPIQASMVLCGFRLAEAGAGT